MTDRKFTTWHNVYSNISGGGDPSREVADRNSSWVGPQHSTRSEADREELRFVERLYVYRIERDEDGGNPEIFKEEV